jgi:hypothetical protein
MGDACVVASGSSAGHSVEGQGQVSEEVGGRKGCSRSRYCSSPQRNVSALRANRCNRSATANCRSLASVSCTGISAHQ